MKRTHRPHPPKPEKTPQNKKKRVKKPLDRQTVWLRTLLVAYLALLVWLVLLKLSFSIPYRNCGINWIPFDFSNAANRRFSYLETAANIVVFMPLGGYLTMLGVRRKRIVPIGAGVSLFFELAQYAFNMGVADITDLLTNTAGTAIGFGGYLLLRRIFRKDPAKLDRTMTVLATVVTALSAAFFLWALAVEIVMGF